MFGGSKLELVDIMRSDGISTFAFEISMKSNEREKHRNSECHGRNLNSAIDIQTICTFRVTLMSVIGISEHIYCTHSFLRSEATEASTQLAGDGGENKWSIIVPLLLQLTNLWHVEILHRLIDCHEMKFLRVGIYCTSKGRLLGFHTVPPWWELQGNHDSSVVNLFCLWPKNKIYCLVQG